MLLAAPACKKKTRALDRGADIVVSPPGPRPWLKTEEYSEQKYLEKARFELTQENWDFHLNKIRPLGVGPGMIVADVGAGAGNMAWSMATVVGATGRVIAIDINPLAVKVMRRRLKEAPPPQHNLEVLHSHPWNVDISRTAHNGKVDRALLLSAHFFASQASHDRGAVRSCLRSLYCAMKPGGVIAVIESANDPEAYYTDLFRRIGFELVRVVKDMEREVGSAHYLLFRRPASSGACANSR